MRQPLVAFPPNIKLPYALLKGRGVEGWPLPRSAFWPHPAWPCLPWPGSPVLELSLSNLGSGLFSDIIIELHRSWQRLALCPERQRSRVSLSVAPHKSLLLLPSKTAASYFIQLPAVLIAASRLTVNSSSSPPLVSKLSRCCSYSSYIFLSHNHSFVFLQNQNHYYTEHRARSMMICIKILWLHITFIVFI